MAELSTFMFAVLDHWVAVMSGAVSLAIGVYEKIKDKTVKSGFFFAVSMLCLFVALFFAWRDEHRALEKTQQELSVLTTGIKGEFLTVALYPANNGQSVAVYTLVSIGNLGKPSVFRRWRMNIEGLNLLNMLPVRIPEGTIIPDGTSKIIMSKEVIMSEKETIPLPEGGEMRGWLAFNIHGIPLEDVQRHIATMKMDFSDVRDVQYSIPFNLAIMSMKGDRYYSHSGQE